MLFTAWPRWFKLSSTKKPKSRRAKRSARARFRPSVSMLEDRVTPVNIGYYDMSLGQGNPSQVASIVAAGQTPVLLNDLSAADLVGIQVIDVQNPDNGAYGAEYLSRLIDIENAVSAGAVLLIHDRFVDPAETILPGGAGFNIVRETSAAGTDIDVLDNTTLVTNGPGGIVDNTTLDGGNLSDHGYAVAASLPGAAKLILSRADPTQIVTFSYSFGAGTVIYSTIPLDFYLGGGTNFDIIYAPNVKAYAAIGINTPPTISDIPDQTIDEDANTGPLAFTIADAQTPPGSLIVNTFSSNPGLVPNANIVLGGGGANRTVTVTPLANLSGTATITVQVSDGTNTTSDTFLLTVNPINDAPTITPIADQITSENSSTGAIPFTIGDVESPAGSLNVTGTSLNTTLVPDANIVFGGSGANRTVTVTPAANQLGTAFILINVSDGTDSTTEIFLLTVNAIPTITDIPDQVIDEDTSTGALPFTIGDVETPPGSLTLTRNSSDTTLVPISNIILGGSGANRTVTVNPAPDQYGTAIITLTVTDGIGISAQDTFVVTVLPINDVPIPVILGVPPSPPESATIDLNASQVDPDSTAWTYLWSVTASNGQVIAPGAGPNFGFTPNEDGIYTVTLQVTDNGSGATGPLTGTKVTAITVLNLEPAPSAGGPYKVFAGSSVQLKGTAVDPAGSRDPVTLTWDLDGDGVFGETGLAATRGDEVGANPLFKAVGFSTFTIYNVSLKATDDDGGSAITTSQVTVFPLSYRFDFDASTLATQFGYQSVRGSTLYDATRGFGWAQTATEFDHADTTALLRDGHLGTDNTFRVRVNPGTRYQVTMYFRDRFDRTINIYAEGILRVSGLRVRKTTLVSDLVPRSYNPVKTVTFYVTSFDGVLDLRLRGLGLSPIFVLNGLQIVKA